MDKIPETTMPVKVKNAWKKLITKDIVSSEDEEIEADRKFFVKRPKLNRGRKLDSFFEKLDNITKDTSSTRGKYRSFDRKIGEPSEKDARYSIEQEDVLRLLKII